MKKLLLFGALAFGLNAFGQVSNGIYQNEAGQKLIISNLSDCCFDFEVTWGVMDEWGCLFYGAGNATLSSGSSAYFGEDPEWADIEFTIEGNTITVTGGFVYVGADCARYGSSFEGYYTRFSKKE